MARNFYKSGGSYYYSDNNQKILNDPELRAAAKAGGKDMTSAQSAVDKEKNAYDSAITSHPGIPTGSSVDDIIKAASSGDWTGIVSGQGQPFSAADEAAAMAKGNAATAGSFAEQQANDRNAAMNSLKNTQGDYADTLASEAQQFQNDKATLDQNAADNGMLFSGGRIQKQNNLLNAYNQTQATNLRKATSDISNTANNFQYKYGNDAANGLSQYYNLGSNSYNPNVATGGATTNGLSSVYNPSASNFQGTVNNQQKNAAATYGAGLLWNQGNKLVTTGNQNQYK